MPTYQYACTSHECGNEFELVQSFTDPSASECPVCAGPVRKVFSAVGVVFKGSGFYHNDSRSERKHATDTSESASTPSSDSSNGSGNGSSHGSSNGSSSNGSGSSGSSPAANPSSAPSSSAPPSGAPSSSAPSSSPAKAAASA